VYNVVVKKVHVRYLISWWVSCYAADIIEPRHIGVNGYNTLGGIMSRRHEAHVDVKGVDSKTLKACRGLEIGRGYSPPQSTRGLWGIVGSPSWVRGSGWNWILHNLNAKETIQWHILHWIFYLTVTLKLCSCAWHKNLLCIFYVKYNQKAKWWSPQSVYVCVCYQFLVNKRFI